MAQYRFLSQLWINKLIPSQWVFYEGFLCEDRHTPFVSVSCTSHSQYMLGDYIYNQKDM